VTFVNLTAKDAKGAKIKKNNPENLAFFRGKNIEIQYI